MISNPESPRLGGELFGVVNAYARAGGYVCGRDAEVSLKPNGWAQEVCAIKSEVNVHRDAQFAWARRQVALIFDWTTRAHDLYALDRLKGAHEDGVRHGFSSGHDVELKVDAVDKVDVSRAAPAEHRFGAPGAAIAEGVRCPVLRAHVGFRLDYAPRDAQAFYGWHDEALAQQLAGDQKRVVARIESAWK